MFSETIDLTVHRREGVCMHELTDYASRQASVHQLVDLSYRLFSEAMTEAFLLMDEDQLDDFFEYLFRRLPDAVAQEPAKQQLAELYLQAFRGRLSDRADEEARQHAA